MPIGQEERAISINEPSANAPLLTDEDRRLIADCLEGQDRAWRDFFERFTRLVYHAIQKVAHLKGFPLALGDIEDLHNQVFLSFMENEARKLRQFQGRNECRLSTWVGLIATRQTLDFMGKNRRREDSLEGDPTYENRLAAPQPSADRSARDREDWERLRQAVEGLPGHEQVFYQLLFVEEREAEEIAQILGTSVSNVYSKKSRLVSKLRNLLQE